MAGPVQGDGQALIQVKLFFRLKMLRNRRTRGGGGVKISVDRYSRSS